MSTLEVPTPTSTTTAEPQTGPTVRLTERAPRGTFLTVESGAYLLIGIISLLAHLWGLGDRALHHDETLHAFYSWRIYTGQGYIHDPLLHGPFLYYFGALIYFLFGDSDFTARLGAALFGTVLTLLPLLLRRELGRPAALMAAVYLLISPTFLYVGRFIRHDIYSVVFEMLVFVAIVRYAGTRQAGWLYLGAAAFGLMLTNQETSYLFLLLIGTPLVLLLLWRVYRPGVAILGGLAVALALLVFVLPGTAQVDGSHTATRDPETGRMEYTPGPLFGWYPLETADNAYALRIRHQPDNEGGQGLLANTGSYAADLWLFFGHPAILTGIALLLGSSGLLLWLIWWRKGPDGQTAWQRARHNDNTTVLATFASLTADWRWLVALGIFFTIYALLFTAFLTNILGVVTGTTGSLLYWLAQHNVERGGQPPYYYLVLLIVYEPLLLLWTTIGLILVGKDLLQRKGQQILGPLFLAWWALGAFGIYSWAGEKMPWLSIHVALPMVLLAAWACQRVLRGVWTATGGAAVDAEIPDHATLEDRFNRITPPLFIGVFIAVAGLGFVLMTTYANADTEIAIPGWIIPSILLVLWGLLVAAAGMYRNWRWSLSMLALCVTLLGSAYTIRNAYRLSFLSGDTPREMLIYTQTSPDVMHVVRRLEEASRRRGGGLDIPILYDNETVWQWYFRDFTNARRVEPRLTAPPGEEIQAVFMLQENISRNPENSEYLQDFRLQQLPLRWWFPEGEIYNLGESDHWRTAPLDEVSLLAQALRAPFADETIVNLWDFLMYRDTNARLGSTDFVLAVRPVLADQIGLGTGAELNSRP